MVLPGTSSSTTMSTTDGEILVQQDQQKRLINEQEEEHNIIMDDTNDYAHDDDDDEQQQQQEGSRTTTRDTKDESRSTSGTTMMIGLYYYYFSNGHISLKEVEEHVDFQKQLCTATSLSELTGGRIRVCREGLNGVLSGTRDALEKYEHALEDELKRIEAAHSSKKDDNENEDVLLDMKYCHLRSDLSTKEQLFKEWSIKSTSEVVSLHVGGGDDEEVNGKHNRSRKKKKKKKNKGTLYPYHGASAASSSCNNNTNHNPPTTTDIGTGASIIVVTTDDDDEKETPITTQVDNNVEEKTTTRGATGNINNKAARVNSTTTTNNNNYKTKYIPAQHLSPEEWHAKLVSKLKSGPDTAGDVENADHKDDNDKDDNDDIILVDARNVYESRVGYFEVPHTTTLFTNTRKYSDLPHVLQSNLSNLSNKHVMMYCTGGVRCERASQYLQSLFDSTNDASHSSDNVIAPPKGIYQLKGGIQRYLEQYGSSNLVVERPNNGKHEEEDDNNDNGNDKDNINNHHSKEHENDHDDDDNKKKEEEEVDDDDNDDGTPQNEAECFFKGKNFVFDPRRLDPVCHPSESVVGRCLICNKRHDDYDNGCSPSASKEARCCRCRILILICNTCRQTHTCWGEDSSPDKPNVFCGPNGLKCIDEGNLCSTTSSIHKK